MPYEPDELHGELCEAHSHRLWFAFSPAVDSCMFHERDQVESNPVGVAFRARRLPESCLAILAHGRGC